MLVRIEDVSLYSSNTLKHSSIKTWEEAQDSALFEGTECIQDTMKEVSLILRHVCQNVEARKLSTEVDEDEQREEERRKRIAVLGTRE